MGGPEDVPPLRVSPAVQTLHGVQLLLHLPLNVNITRIRPIVHALENLDPRVELNMEFIQCSVLCPQLILTLRLYKKYTAISRTEKSTVQVVAAITRLVEAAREASSSTFTPIDLCSRAWRCLILKSVLKH